MNLQHEHEVVRIKSNTDDGWFGILPEHWEVVRSKCLFNQRKEMARKNDIQLSATQAYGVISQAKYESLSGNTVVKIIFNLDKRKHVEIDDFVISMRSFQGGLEHAKESGCIRSSYVVLRPLRVINSSYFAYLFKLPTYISALQKTASFIRDGQDLNFSNFSQVALFIPPIEEQDAIAKFLDKKSAQINEAITIKERQITLLKECKQIIIQNAVMQGLNPSVPMKNSGVEWIGNIPEHWEVRRLKYVLEERAERSKTGEEPLFMVSQIHGLVVRADYHDKAEVAASNIDNKLVYKNDLVFNKLKAHLGVFFKSNIEFTGLVSPDYAVYTCKAYISDAKYLEILFRHPSYIQQFIVRATGIVEGLIRLYTGDLFDIHVPIAPLDEQAEILAYAEKQSNEFDRAIELQKRQIEKLKEYKTTLIDSAVTGKIRITPEMLEQ